MTNAIQMAAIVVMSSPSALASQYCGRYEETVAQAYEQMWRVLPGFTLGLTVVLAVVLYSCQMVQGLRNAH